ncbi:unnamed protein product [Adineta steineri]|uniref:Uncharacterized protein n=1 Tax=Adineta steineri TaxID=433720 RepID=A0A815LAD8_9BILA|nr:unnamed protein product [Adineta steineri]CAF1443987.1 unnamed protein product [Adineta steineri]CAF3882819.1 unnamed protein product [Adineta steineri]
MKYIQLIVLISLVVLVSSISIGQVPKARLLPGSSNQIVWLFNQVNFNAYLCNALNTYSLSQIAAFNMYSLNSTCQIILSLPVLSPRIISDVESTLILLHPLTDVPCCSDLSWLLDRIKFASQPSGSVTQPTSISINSNNTLISTMIYEGSFVSFYRNNLSLEGIHPLPSRYKCVTAYYRRGFLFMGCNIPSELVIFKEADVKTPISQINMPLNGRGVSFARNDTLIFGVSQYGNLSIYIYNINWTPNISTSIVQTFTPTSLSSWAIDTVNDNFVLMTSWDSSTPVYAIQSSSDTSNIWSRIPINATKTGSTEFPGEAVTDSCGRIWMVVYGFVIRIFDPSGTILLANWTLSTGLSNILLLANYELFVTDYDGNSMYHFNPNLQCTR